MKVFHWRVGKVDTKLRPLSKKCLKCHSKSLQGQMFYVKPLQIKFWHNPGRFILQDYRNWHEQALESFIHKIFVHLKDYLINNRYSNLHQTCFSICLIGPLFLYGKPQNIFSENKIKLSLTFLLCLIQEM